MSFILNPFIFEQLEDFYERILTMPYTYNAFAVSGVVETKVIRIPYTYNFNIYVNLETYKIVKMPYTYGWLTTANNESYFLKLFPYTYSSNVEPTSSGLGTSTVPYYIWNAYDLNNVRTKDSRSYFKVMADIDMSGYTNFVPLPKLHGDFNGNNKKISNLRITIVSASFYGLFSQYYPTSSNVFIHDLILDNVLIEHTESFLPSAQNYYGCVVGYYQGYTSYKSFVKNCHVINSTINLSGSNANNGHSVGGLIGFVSSLGGVESCSVQNSNIYVYPTSLLSNIGYAGGLVGQIDSIYQPISSSFVSKTTVYARRSTDNGTSVGGIVGSSKSSIFNSYVFSCSVSTTGSLRSNGIADGYGDITTCYAHANSGSFSIPTTSEFYPMSNDLATSSCYYDYEYGNGIVSGAGVPLSSSQMILSESFDGFDFVNIWTSSLDKQNNYPYLISLADKVAYTTASVAPINQDGYPYLSYETF
jgi:hypothetical protein